MRGPLGPFCASLGFFEQNEEIYLKNSLIEFGITFADFVEFLFFVFFFFFCTFLVPKFFGCMELSIMPVLF